MANYLTPCNSKEVKQFIGLSNYYHCYIPSYTEIAKPLTQLLRKNAKAGHLSATVPSTTLKPS